MHLLHYQNRIYEKLLLLVFDLFSLFSINPCIIFLYYSKTQFLFTFLNCATSSGSVVSLIILSIKEVSFTSSYFLSEVIAIFSLLLLFPFFSFFCCYSSPLLF